MAQIIHNISEPNDGLGDELRTAMGHQNSMNTELYTNKVDKVTGKQLSTNDFTNAQVTKLAGIEEGAEVNVQPDWTQLDTDADDYIKNKPQQVFSSVGYFHYNDTATQITPLTILPDTELQLTNNQLGAQTNLDQAPYGVATVFNSTTNKFDFSALTIGDAMTLRIDLKLTTTSANQKYKVYLRVGDGGAEEYDLLVFSGQIKSISTDYQIVGEIGFSLDYQSHIDNPAVLYIFSDDDGLVKVNGFYTFILRKGVNIITGGGGATFQELFAANSYEIISDADGTGAQTTIDLVGNKFEVFRRSFGGSALMKFFIEANDDAVTGSAKLPKSNTDEVVAYRSNLSYSTTEKLTGGTWIDSKPIYKKVIEYTFDSSGGGVSIAHGISDLESIVEGKIINQDTSRRVDTITVSLAWGDCFVTNTNVEIENISAQTDITINIILEYTKTTD